MSPPLLQVASLEAGYDASNVLFGVDLEIRRGEVVGLLGRNGMGKSTTVKCLAGLVRPTAGSMSLDGAPLPVGKPHRFARLGVGLVPEGRRIFPNLTVRENLVAFAAPGRDGRAQWNLERVLQFFPALAQRSRNAGGNLSGGEQQMLAIGRAMMTNPKLLVLDEATEGLAPLVRQQIWQCLRALKEDGALAILLIDKYVDEFLDIANRHYILERGRIAWSGTSAELGADRALWERYLGL